MFFIVFKKPNKISEIENRTLSYFHKPSFKSILNGEFQKNFDSAFQDQFVKRDLIINIYKKFENKTRTFSNLFRSKDSINEFTLNPLGNNTFLVGNKGKQMMEFPFVYDKNIEDTLIRKANFYNYIIDNFPQQKYYIYRVKTLPDYNWFDEANDIKSVMNNYKEKFLSILSSKFNYLENNHLNLDDYHKYGYYTDHHLNYEGAKKAYEDISSMVFKDYPEIKKPIQPIDKFCSDAKFYGSMQKNINYVKPEIYDQICEYKYELKKHRIYLNDKQVEKLGNRDEYYENRYNKDDYINRYRDWFGFDAGLVQFDYDNNTGVNALIVSDSFSNAFKDVLASHFDKTYYLDLRYYERDLHKKFSYKDFLEKNKIDVVIFIGGSVTIYADETFNLN